MAGMMETARRHGECEEDKRPWCVFHNDVVREIARMTLHEDCGLQANNTSVLLTVRWASR